MQPLAEHIDWTRPWLRPLLPYRHVVAADDWLAELNCLAREADLRNHRHSPVRFVPQAYLPTDTAYELFISESGAVPTRRNAHDFFNALIWLNFPTTKKQLNALQADAIQRRREESLARTSHGRGALRDAITVFDENGAVFVCADPRMAALLRERCWVDLFVRERDHFLASCEVWLFGHAILEKLLTPFKAITAHALPLHVEKSYFRLSHDERKRLIDSMIANDLDHGFTTRSLLPLPVAGIPGWAEQQDEQFYLDSSVFRPKRQTAGGSHTKE